VVEDPDRAIALLEGFGERVFRIGHIVPGAAQPEVRIAIAPDFLR